MTWHVKIEDENEFQQRNPKLYLKVLFWILCSVLFIVIYIVIFFILLEITFGLLLYLKQLYSLVEDNNLMITLFFFTSWVTYLIAVKLLYPGFCWIFAHSEGQFCCWLISIYFHNCFIEAGDPVLSNYLLFWRMAVACCQKFFFLQYNGFKFF